MVESSHTGRSSLDDEACAWLERFARGDGRRADIAELKRWMAQSAAHAEAFDRISRVWSSLEPIGEKLVAKGLISPKPRQRSSIAVSPVIGRRALIGGALAASAAGAAVLATHPPLGLWPSWDELTADFRTRPGEQRQITLADQVSIQLNTRTSLAINTPDASEARLIAGETLISSPPQMQVPFTLLVDSGRIVATGARFNARIGDDQRVCVTCLAGAVRVEHGKSVLSLAAGQQVGYSSAAMESPVTVDATAVAAWRDGVVIFESTPIADVIAEVNRYRSGKIILTNKELGRRLFDARLRLENIGNVVRQIELTFGVRATELPGGIVLLG